MVQVLIMRCQDHRSLEVVAPFEFTLETLILLIYISE
jgi:hypothetical protein